MEAKRAKQEEASEEVQMETGVAAHLAVIPDKVFVCLDVSGSIRGGCMYPKWVSEDIAKLEGPTDWVLWGSSSETRAGLDSVQKYLADEDECLGGTCPQQFIEHLPASGVIDLYVYTDGEIGEGDVAEARRDLDEKHADLRVRQVVITYVNSNLDSMNVGLSAIFEGHVLEVHRTRVADGKKLHQFDAPPLQGDVSTEKILDDHIGLDKTEQDMTKGMHYLAQRFANVDPKRRRDIRRLVRERMDAVNREFRSKELSAEQEQDMLAAIADKDWQKVRALFIGHAVPKEVKLMQAYCQKFLNETKHGALIRVSAYAPLILLKAADKGGDFDEQEDVLLDHITYLGLGKEAIIVLPATLSGNHTRILGNHVKCALAFDGKFNFDNTFSLDTLFVLRESQSQGVGGGDDGGEDNWGEENWGDEPNVLEQLAAQIYQEPRGDSTTLCSSTNHFGVNPFNRQRMELVFLVPVDSEALPAERLSELDAWNAHMLSRFVRSGRSMPSVALTMALVLERCFESWRQEVQGGDDAAKADKLVQVCRRYLARYPTPLTFTVGLPVVIRGSFSTAARLACGVLAAGLDPALPVDVLTQFWSNMEEGAWDDGDAPHVWAALRSYAGLPLDAAFPITELTTIKALASGVQYRKSARDAALRQRKGPARGWQYAARKYNQWLDHLVVRGCVPARLRHEELAARQDLLAVPVDQPLLCLHGCPPEDCKPQDDSVETVCGATGKPTLLNKDTMDMWYVNQPQDAFTRQSESFHKAMWQLARKRNKGKQPRFTNFPPECKEFLSFVNHRVRDFSLHRGDVLKGDYSAARLLPTEPCSRLVSDVSQVHMSYSNLKDMGHKKFRKVLRQPRAVCGDGPCCEYIRRAVTPQQLAWINSHATLEQVAGDQDVLSGKLSYRQAVQP